MPNTVYLTSKTNLFLTSTLYIYNDDFPKRLIPDIKLFVNEYDAIQNLQNNVKNAIGYAEELCNDLDYRYAWIVLSGTNGKTILIKDDGGRFHGADTDFLSQIFNALPQDSPTTAISLDLYNVDITNRKGSFPRTIEDGLLFHSDFVLVTKNIN